jgi:4-alpha-glucanotransferase
MKSQGYGWWIDRLRWATRNFDYIRLDHFRGFSQFWEIPANEPTAINGRWVDGPKDDFFEKVRETLGGLPFFAEDLGYITPDVHALRDRLQIPGMAVLQFGFGNPGAHIHLPHTFTTEKVVYTGTHDNDTLRGWWNSALPGRERRHVETYLGRSDDGINWAMIRAALNSSASLAVVPLQDVLGLGSEARMNVPSLNGGNWCWRFSPEMLRPEFAQKLAVLAEVCDRIPEPLSATTEDWAA